MADTSMHQMSESRQRGSAGEVALFLLAAVVLVASRFHAFDVPLEVDECVYAYTGERLLEGDRLYVDVWDHHPFGGYALFAGAIALFGNSPAVFRWMATGFSLVSLGLVWSLARRAGGARAAVLAGLLFAIASSDPGTAGEGCNREIYMVTLILAAWRLVDGRSGMSWFHVFAAGGLIGLASAFKMVAAVHWLGLGVWVVVAARKLGNPWSGVARALFWFSLGPLILWAGTVIYFAATGRWAAFADATILFNLGYASRAGGLWRFARFFHPLGQPYVFESAAPVWIAGGLAVIAYVALLARRRCLDILPVMLLVVAGYVSTCLPGRFFAHYYYLAFVPIVLLVGIACADLAEWIVRVAANRAWLGWLPAGVLITALALSETVHYYAQPPYGITEKRYHGRDFWGRAIGEKLARVTDPQDRVFVYGNEAEIYYYADRRCASRHVMLVGLEEGSRGLELHRRQLLDDLRTNKPRVILLTLTHGPFPGLMPFLNEHYGQPVGWAFHDRQHDQVILYVLADPDRPIETIDWNWNRPEERE